MTKTEGGTFDPREECIYFIAANPDRQQEGVVVHPYILVAVNELKTDKQLEMLGSWIDKGAKVLIDSGIYNLTMEHSRNHDVSMDTALSLAPDQIDGFPQLLERYTTIVKEYGPKAWGYIELDQGGAVNKRKTRSLLHAAGFAPIPVYHPLVDGWDYFDELCSTHDRICIGNIVHASEEARVRILSTIYERRRKYPDLWTHTLGLTPNEWMNAIPTNSADSSTWLVPIRYPAGIADRAMLKPVSKLAQDFQYVRQTDRDSPTGSGKACRMSAIQSGLTQRNWRNAIAAYEKIGASPWAR
mgnify:CR=1 FL=1